MIIMKIMLPEGKSLQYIYYIIWIFLKSKHTNNVHSIKYVGPWDPLLQCLHLDKHLLGQQNTQGPTYLILCTLFVCFDFKKIHIM